MPVWEKNKVRFLFLFFFFFVCLFVFCFCFLFLFVCLFCFVLFCFIFLFCFVFYLFLSLFVFLENVRFVCYSTGKGPNEGALPSILKHLKVYYAKTHLTFSLIFAENVKLLSRNIIKLIPLGASTSKYRKSAFSMWLYEGDNHANSAKRQSN